MTEAVRAILAEALEHGVAYREELTGSSAAPRLGYAALRDRLLLTRLPAPSPMRREGRRGTAVPQRLFLLPSWEKVARSAG